MAIHYDKDSATAEYLLLSAELEHDSGVTFEFKNGHWIIEGVVEIDHFQRALDLLRDIAA
jgi:hypothetical protein